MKNIKDIKDIKDDVFTRESIARVVDHIRSSGNDNELVTDRICNYIDANIDEFMECYADTDNE